MTQFHYPGGVLELTKPDTLEFWAGHWRSLHSIEEGELSDLIRGGVIQVGQVIALGSDSERVSWFLEISQVEFSESAPVEFDRVSGVHYRVASISEDRYRGYSSISEFYLMLPEPICLVGAIP